MQRIFDVQGNQTVESIHKKLGKVIWEYCGMARNKSGLEKALILVQDIKDEFWETVKISGKFDTFNNELDNSPARSILVENLVRLPFSSTLYFIFFLSEI